MSKRQLRASLPDPVDIHVGARVRQKRIGMGMSQTKLGNAIGVTFQQVQKYENGSNRISASCLYKIAETLGVKAAFFFEELDPPDHGMSKAYGKIKHDPLNSPEAIRLIYDFYRISDLQVRKRICQLVNSLTESSD